MSPRTMEAIVAPPLAASADAFAAAMLAWIAARFAPPGVAITADTPLFADRLIDSIRILELIAWTERATGREVPDAEIRMDNFRTVRRIAEVFVGATTTGGSDARLG
jgi:methoxymalonate biosynthesis acyl carrier protein